MYIICSDLMCYCTVAVQTYRAVEFINKKLSYRRETARQLRTSFSAKINDFGIESACATSY